MNRSRLLAAVAALAVAGSAAAAVTINGKGGLIRVNGGSSTLTTTTTSTTTSNGKTVLITGEGTAIAAASKPSGVTKSTTRTTTTSVPLTSGVQLANGTILVPGQTYYPAYSAYSAYSAYPAYSGMLPQRGSVLGPSVPARPIGPTISYFVPTITDSNFLTTGAAVYLDPMPFSQLSPTYPQYAGFGYTTGMPVMTNDAAVSGFVNGYPGNVGYVNPTGFSTGMGGVTGLNRAIANGAFVPTSGFRTINTSFGVNSRGFTSNSPASVGSATTGSLTGIVGAPAINSSTALTPLPGGRVSGTTTTTGAAIAPIQRGAAPSNRTGKAAASTPTVSKIR